MALSALSAFKVPGFRRRLIVEATPGAVTAMLEDDMHCMAVSLRHDGVSVLNVEPHQMRAPWTTCTGAQEQLVRTFEGLPLTAVTSRKDKRSNCTHLHDLAVLAAAHASESGRTQYDIAASDPVEGSRTMEIHRNGVSIHSWIEVDALLTSPADIAGMSLFELRNWIDGLEEPGREAARLLQWGGIMAHGRTIPYEQQSDATQMPPNCFTFQPARAAEAVRVGRTFDFSGAIREPLAGMWRRGDLPSGMSWPE